MTSPTHVEDVSSDGIATTSEPSDATTVLDNNDLKNETKSKPTNGETKRESSEETWLLTPEITETAKDVARGLSYATITCILIFAVVVSTRFVVHVLNPPQPSLFCRLFCNPFKPIFDALCGSTTVSLWDEMAHVSSDVLKGISEFFTSMANGIRAFETIFAALSEGIFASIGSGIGELLSNVHENIAFLVHFFVNFVCSILSGIQTTIELIVSKLDALRLILVSQH